MPRPLPVELRERVVRAWKAGEGSFATLARRFRVGDASVNRWVARERETGSVEPFQMGGRGGRPPRVDEEGERFLIGILEEVPDMTLRELCHSYLEKFEKVISPQTMSTTVRRLGFTRKRGAFRPKAAQRADVLEAREVFVREQPSLDAARLVFLDEAGTSLAMSYNYGWAPPGEKPIIERPLRGKNITLIGAIALDGTRALRRVEHSVNGEEFVSFLREELCPNLHPGDIVVMDGPRLHRVAGVAEALEEVGAVPLYLPAYSPEFNPIEMTWSWLKTNLRRVSPRHIGPLRATVEKIWASVTSELCQAWIRHCGYSLAST